MYSVLKYRIYNIVLVSGVQQSDSVIYIYIYIYTHTKFQIIFHYRLLQTIEYHKNVQYKVNFCF